MRKIDSKTLELMRNVVGCSPELQKTYPIEVVTPMFGGGVEAGVNDESKLIRETSIRGMLRFWFRATIGADCKTPEELFLKEREIFGTTDTPSRLKVRVSHIQSQKPETYGELSPKQGSVLGYALFPFAANSRDNIPERSGRRLNFNLTLSYPKKFEQEFEQEVEVALWAWLNFGGIGARTRRGCGTLYCQEFAPGREGNKVVWNQKFASSTLENSAKNIRKWSTLGEAFLRPTIKNSNPKEAWSEVIADYKYYRQDSGFARNKKKDGSAGRSFWPEPDAIRQITKRNSPRHVPYKDRPIAFPRVELGAPINFHFKDKSIGDPQDVLVRPIENGKIYERASSPLIVKPLVFDDKTAVPCVVFLNGSHVKKVVAGNRTEEWDVIVKENAAYANAPLKRLSAKGSALEGFKNYVKHNDYEAIQ